MTLRFDNPASVSREEFERDLALLPQWRRDKALSYRFLLDRVLCAKAYLLLKDAVRCEFGIAEDLEFEYDSIGGKPFLKGHRDIHFNLSHCRSAVMCTVSRSPVGCDVEDVAATLDMDLCRTCFSNDEVSRIVASTDPCVEFTRLWTMKEALLKLTGEGLSVHDLPGVLQSPRAAGVEFEVEVDPAKKWVSCVCCRR